MSKPRKKIMTRGKPTPEEQRNTQLNVLESHLYECRECQAFGPIPTDDHEPNLCRTGMRLITLYVAAACIAARPSKEPAR